MATYLILTALTDEGRKTLKARPQRLREVNRELQGMGGHLRTQLALLGPYDFINVVEAPDNETIARISTELGSRGTARLTTLPATPLRPRESEAGLDEAGPGTPSTFVVFTTLTAVGRTNPGQLGEVEQAAERLGAAIAQQYRVLGDYDYVTFVRAADNDTASRIATEVSSLGAVQLNVYPAISLERFMELLGQKAHRVTPHTWQTQLWARLLRRTGRYWVMTRHVRRLCRPFTVEGVEQLSAVHGPAIIIANHSSHFDTPAVLTALPARVRERTAVAAAADRFYRATKRSWWYSLFWNTFPIARGGGKSALDYPLALAGGGWSILIYPEGGRSQPGQVQRFRHGPTVLALRAQVPVIPVYLEGLHDVMPRGERAPRPGPVSVRIGAPVSLEGVASVPEGTARLEDAMRLLAGLPPASLTVAGPSEAASEATGSHTTV